MLDNPELFEAHRKALQEPRIHRIDESKAPWSGRTYWLVGLDDGRQASTLNSEIAQEAYRLKGLDLPVRMERQKTDFGLYVDADCTVEDTMNPWVPKSIEDEASPEAVARREAEYDRIAPRWRQEPASYMIRNRSDAYLERRPYDGAWTWDACFPKHASRFTLDGAMTILQRLEMHSVARGAKVCAHYTAGEGPNVTNEHLASGELAMNRD